MKRNFGQPRHLHLFCVEVQMLHHH